MSKQHLIDGHTRSAERAVANAKCFKTMAAHFGSLSELSKTMDRGPADILQGLSGECSAMADGCADDAEFHVNAAKNLSAASKAMLADDRDEIAPSRVSGIAPDRSGIRQVYRAGQRENPQQPAEIFSKIFGVGTEEDE